MITHYLGSEEVTAYNRDLTARLVRLGNAFPKNWFMLGLSGRKLYDSVGPLLPASLVEKIKIGLAHYNREHREIRFSDETPVPESFQNEPALILDAAVHSGRSMLALVQKLQSLDAGPITSYSLVLKRGSVVVPTYFGVVIEDKDRVYFDLNTLPINRLAKPAPPGVLRAIIPSDLPRRFSGLRPPFDDLTVGDLIYDRDAHGSNVYVFEYGIELVGFISFQKRSGTVFIDGWAAADLKDANGDKIKIGSALFRWAETWARSAKCDRIELWGYEPAVPIYEYMNFRPVETEWRILGNGQRYRVMERPILYNIKISEDSDIEYTE